MATVSASSLIITRRRHRVQYFTEDLGKGIGLDMVLIPAGRFSMGSAVTEAGRDDDEGPEHLVILGQAFCMGRYPITQAQYKVVTGKAPSRFQDAGENRPVERVSWRDAVAFCEQLSAITNRVYRLPSEAEWEYACRAGTTTPFHFGQQLTPEVANYGGNLGRTSAVGDFGVANSFGLSDMHGNVWEWCADHWHDTYQGAPGDGRAWLSGGDESLRVLRGGSWLDLPWFCRSANRFRFLPGNTDISLGFRVVCSAPRTD